MKVRLLGSTIDRRVVVLSRYNPGCMKKLSDSERRIQSRIVANPEELAMVKAILTDPIKLAYIENWYFVKGAKVPDWFIEGLKK